MKFGRRLRKLRKEQGLTIVELADKFNYGKSAFSSYERGTRKPPIDLVENLSDYFNVTVDYLLGKTDQRKPDWYQNLPKKLKKFVDKHGIEYLAAIEKGVEKGVDPRDIETIIETFEDFKPILDRLSEKEEK